MSSHLQWLGKLMICLILLFTFFPKVGYTWDIQIHYDLLQIMQLKIEYVKDMYTFY